MKLNRFHYIGFAVVLLALLFFLPIKWHYSIETTGKIVPAKEWVLQKTNDGSLIATLADNRNGFVQNYSVIQIQRGDATRFQMSPSLNEKRVVMALDTIGSIHSYAVLADLTELEGDLIVAKATLRTQLVGEKAAIIEEARQQLALAQERAALLRKRFLRQDSLFHRNLVSLEEYELVQSEAEVAAIEVNIAEVQLQTVTTGAKPEQIKMIEAEIQSIEDDIRIRKSQVEAFTLQTPISGRIYRSFTSDTLLTVCDTSFVLIMPLNWKHREYLNPGQTVSLKSGGPQLTAKILRIEDIVKILDQEQVYMAVALIEGKSETLTPNLIIPCTVRCSSVSSFHYAIRLIKSLFNM